MSVVFRLSPGSISSDCHGYRDGGPPSSGVCGTMRGISQTRFPYSASIWRTFLPRNTSLGGHNTKITAAERAMAETSAFDPVNQPIKNPALRGFLLAGGERGIRTLDTRLTYTPLAGERLQPLGHLSSFVDQLSYLSGRRHQVVF